MSKNWYPVVDYAKCTECGTCVEFCQHSVYDKTKTPSPKVVSPENCVEGCRGCSNQCPTDAISYVGDSKMVSGNCSCGCGGCC